MAKVPSQRSLYLGSTRLALKFGMEVTAAGVAIAVHALYSSMVGKIRESNAFFFFLTLVPDALQHYASPVALVGFRRKAPTAAMDSAAAIHFGGPILPCAGIVRRKLVKKYHINETWCCSVLHVICCPGVSMLQMLMEVEDREMGRVGICGKWDANVIMAEPLVGKSYEPPIVNTF
jgi:Cys-rich protein (TIGR01571 family)